MEGGGFLMLNGQITKCRSEAQLAVQVRNCHLSVKCLIAPMLVGGCSLILGIDAISKLGGMTIIMNKQVMLPAGEPTTEVGKVSAVSVGVEVACHVIAGSVMVSSHLLSQIAT